ncbi:MAG: DNA/RNA nuclease SfsA, partial [Bacteriovoracaceae bacterium]|nr:DNA/RNA nuclease SfsA [Bacteriovoracaceae bacterium]
DWKVLVTHADDPKRKLQYTLEMTHNGNSWICVNTGVTNKLVHEALNNEVISELLGYEKIKPEQKYKDSRIDFFLSEHPSHADCFVEVKNVTLIDGDRALFPDSVSTRGQKHLRDLIEIKKQGLRACMMYVINRTDATSFSAAQHIDPTYAELLREASDNGVEILAYQCELSEEEIVLKSPIKVEL